jgi:hypothetical protein
MKIYAPDPGTRGRIDVCYHTPGTHAYFQIGVDYAEDGWSRVEALAHLERAVRKHLVRNDHDPERVIWGRLPLYGQEGRYL